MFKTLIIDDEALARQRIKNLLKSEKQIDLIGECNSGAQAISAIVNSQPDLIYLDIQMKDMNGFEVLENLGEEKLPLIIFVTAFDQYAIRAFDFFAFDYLLKPFKEERFKLSLKKALDALENKHVPQTESQIQALLQYLKKGNQYYQPIDVPKTLPVKSGNKICFIDINDIQYIEASGYYIEIVTVLKKHLLRETLANIIKKLDLNYFIRIHRSTIINMDYLAEINSIGFGDIEAIMKDGKVFRVSKSYKEQLFSRLRI